MKKLILVLLFPFFTISCKKSEDSTYELKNTETPVENYSAEENTRFTFEDFKCKLSNSEKKSKIDFSSNETALDFKTAIIQQYNSEPINFATYYIVTTWGCGTACISGVIIDTRDGKVYDLPRNGFWEGIGNNVNHKADSYLLITSAIQLAQDDKGNIIDLHHYWKWNEKQKKFENLSN